VRASYKDGILEVRVVLPEQSESQAARRIPVGRG